MIEMPQTKMLRIIAAPTIPMAESAPACFEVSVNAAQSNNKFKNAEIEPSVMLPSMLCHGCLCNCKPPKIKNTPDIVSTWKAAELPKTTGMLQTQQLLRITMQP